jgi:hypothetical protein
MHKACLFAIALVAAGAAPVHAQSVDAYDESWHRATFWSGEYPGGFTVLKDVTVQLRPALDPKAGKTIACDLPAKATYQPWNNERVNAQGLGFASFTRIADYEIGTAYDATLYRESDASETPVHFEPGAKWRYLAYYAEGAFLMEYEGVRYTGDQGLFDVSKELNPADGGYEEWLRINCPNNQWGWLFMGDVVVDDVTFAAPNVTGYGEAKDLD